MSSKIFLTRNEIRPTWEFKFQAGADGKWTGSHVFNCRYIDYTDQGVITKLTKDTPITNLDPNIPAQLHFLLVKSHTVEHQKGGITRIRVSIAGNAPEGSDYEFDTDKSTTYSYRGTTQKAPIITHPNYLKDVTDKKTRAAIGQLFIGAAYLKIENPDTTPHYYIYRKIDDEELFSTSAQPAITKWIDKIQAGKRTWDQPALEWSINQTNEGGMSDDDLADFGSKVDKPEGKPPVPKWAESGWWYFGDIAEDKQNNEVANYSRIYTLRMDEYDEDIHVIRP